MNLDPESTDKTFKGLLAKIFRKLAFQRVRGSISLWDRLITNFVLDKKNSVLINNKNSKASAKGNIIKELISPKMSWPVLCKGCIILKYRKIKIRIEAETFDGLVDVVEETVILNIDDLKEEGENES